MKPNRLPTCLIDDQEFFVDVRLCELRQVDNPEHCFAITQAEAEDLATGNAVLSTLLTNEHTNTTNRTS